MNKLAKFIGIAGIAAMSTSVNASVVNVGGVTWDPDATSPADDFVAKAEFEQWFQSADTGIDYDLAVDIVNESSPVGNYLYGSGIFTSFNGVNQVDGAPTPETDPAVFCAGCELTYAFGGIKVTALNQTPVYDASGNLLGNFNNYVFDISNAWVNVYVDHSEDFGNQLPEDEDAIDGELFLALKFDSFKYNAFFDVVGGSVESYLSVDTNVSSLAMGNFDTDSIYNPISQMFSDFKFTSSSQFNLGEDFSSGTNEMFGNSIPEPASLALLGLGLVGVGFARRKKA